MAARARSTRLGYLLAATAAAMWALNGSLARFLLDDGVSALRLAQLRSLLAWIILLAAVGLSPPELPRVERSDVRPPPSGPPSPSPSTWWGASGPAGGSVR